MKKILLSLATLLAAAVINTHAATPPADDASVAATTADPDLRYSVLVPSFASNWYAQFGIDLSLQNPYGCNFSHVFPNGSSLGIDAAIGRWFTPALGLRAKLNWENGIIGNNRANWLAPMYHPGLNHRRGGYLSFAGDVQLDVHNLFCGYNPHRRWNFQVFVRGGALYNFGAKKGSPLIGAGIGSTYRLSPRVSLYADAAYQGVSSGHVGSELNRDEHNMISTGIGNNSNGFFDLNLGVQLNIGSHGFKLLDAERRLAQAERLKPRQELATNSFWRNWYLQFSLDMTLALPYRKNFSQVFPKGKTFGFTGAIGKWFSPEISLRARANWENGFPPFKNDHLQWVASDGDKSNMDCGGYAVLTLDVPVSLTNLLIGYDTRRPWDINIFPRAGINVNFATHGTSPVIGGGVEATYRIAPRWSLLAEYGLQATTSDFFKGVSMTGMSVPTGFNCYMTFQLGIQFLLTPTPFTHLLP